MARRVVIGNGVFKISKSGFDALTASASNLMLDLTTSRPQVVQDGVTAGGGTFVPIVGFSVAPAVLFYHFAIGSFYSGGMGLVDTFTRPFPVFKGAAYNAYCYPTASGVYFYGGGGNPLHFFVFREAL